MERQKTEQMERLNTKIDEQHSTFLELQRLNEEGKEREAALELRNKSLLEENDWLKERLWAKELLEEEMLRKQGLVEQVMAVQKE